MRCMIGKHVGSAKFNINAGLSDVKELIKNVDVFLLILPSLYVSTDSFAPIGQPQNSPHIAIKGIYSLKCVCESFLIVLRGFVNASICNKIELIIVKGSNVGKTANSHRLRPFNAYALVISILASIKKKIKSIENVVKFFFIIL